MAKTKKNVYKGFMNKYPILFQEKDLPMTETCMCWGIECPPGWVEILTKLCDKLEFLNNTICKDNGMQIVATQVKEKYGSLRMYYNLYPFLIKKNQEKTHQLIDDMVHDLIRVVEWESENVCQVCGKYVFDHERIVSGGWIGYYCKECAEEKGIFVSAEINDDV